MQAIHIYLLQHHINWSTSFNLWPVTMFSHFVACCVYGSACANCVSRLSSIGDQAFTWTYPWETGIAELRLFGVLFFVVSPWTVTCYLQKWDPSPDRKSKALKNDAALLRRVERSLVLNGERDVGMGFCETQAVSTWPEVLSNLIIVRVLVKNCLTAVQAWVIQFNNFMQKLCCIFPGIRGVAAVKMGIVESLGLQVFVPECTPCSLQVLWGEPETIHNSKAWKRVMLI